MLNYITRWCCIFTAFLTSALSAEIRGKIDLGPAYAHVDVLESGKTVKAMHMGALKGDATILFWKGLGVKGGFLAASGQGDLFSYNVAVANYTPLKDIIKCFRGNSSCSSNVFFNQAERITLIPSVGVTFTYMSTHINLKEQMLHHLKERFRSSSPYIALELYYKINCDWTIMAMYQYAWSRTHTKITTTRRTHSPFISGKIHGDHGHSDGPNYTLGVDYTINDHWSVNAGAAYNITLSHEKHGLRGYGFKVGSSYYF